MLKHAKRLLTAASAVTVASLVAVGGITAASASPAARPSLSGIEHFQLVSSSATSNKATVVAWGAFTVAGVDVQGQQVDTFKLPGGSFMIKHGPGKGKSSFNPKTCLQMLDLHGNYTLSHGTGKYKGISGRGQYQLSVLLVGARNSKGACSQSKAPLGYQEIIKGTGPVHL
jgi:hypothetical protein